jgi:hypothetical protein
MSNHKKPLCIEGEALELLKQLLKNGFVYTGKNRAKLRFLQRIFPVIKRSQFKNRSIYYLEDKNKLALSEMMKRDTSRIISFQELSRMSQVFNTNLEIQQKRQFLGKNPHRKWWKRQKIKQGHEQSPKEKQSILDDFLGRFLHSEVLSALKIKLSLSLFIGLWVQNTDFGCRND